MPLCPFYQHNNALKNPPNRNSRNTKNQKQNSNGYCIIFHEDWRGDIVQPGTD